ncbi:MAG: type II toxin-antitoxin system HipA family toxin [Phycicoccus sp.]
MSQVEVHVDIAGTPVAAGVAYLTLGRSRVSTTLIYEPGYLGAVDGYDIEPALPRRAGQQYVDGLPGSFADCSPDRWGRNLIDKQRRAAQRDAAHRLPSATDLDYLLGVSDVTRQGALRFSTGGEFLDPGHVVPPLVSLPRLLRAAEQVARDTGDDWQSVRALLDAGSGSLGGARPKASVLGDDGSLLIAKFPHPGDGWDVIAWEKTALDLAERAGLRVPARRLLRVDGRAVLLVARFDREPGGRRRGYISAMTMLGARDGDERDYADIAETLTEFGANVTDDLAELFGRVVLSIAVHNTDDHLRNHGFLHARGGWALSPVFDVNPNPDLGRSRVTTVQGAADPDAEVDALPALAAVCRLAPEQAAQIVARVRGAVAEWRATALGNGIRPAELPDFAEMVEHRTAALARIG